jgi:hypothetical protein
MRGRVASYSLGNAFAAVYDQGPWNVLRPPTKVNVSPSVSADGRWLAVASGNGRPGGSDIVVMHTVARNGGWPTFATGGQSIFFHRRSDDGW